MSTSEALSNKQIVRFLLDQGIDIDLSVPMLFRAMGICGQALATEAGYSRKTLHMALRGERSVPVPLRQKVVDHLGCDPWAMKGDVAAGS